MSSGGMWLRLRVTTGASFAFQVSRDELLRALAGVASGRVGALLELAASELEVTPPLVDAGVPEARQDGAEPSVDDALAEARQDGAEPVDGALEPFVRHLVEARLTEREVEVALLVANGSGRSHVAQRLAISAGTVGRHLTRVLAKLEVQGARELMALAQRLRVGTRARAVKEPAPRTQRRG